MAEIDVHRASKNNIHASRFDDYRTIRLMSRMFRICKDQMDEAEFSFRNGLDIYESISCKAKVLVFPLYLHRLFCLAVSSWLLQTYYS